MAFDPEAFHAEAVRTPSHDDVDEMRALLVETLGEYGVDPDVDDAGNVLATRGEGSPHYVLNTHIDTVPPHVPYEREDGVVRGRGACDAKGPLAALVDAFLATDPDGRLTLAVTPDEETTSAGAAALDLPGAGAPDGFLVGEPTDLDVCNAARGRFEGTVTIRGEAAHAAHPESGRSAIRAAAPVIQAFESYDEREAPRASERASGDGEEPRATPRGPGEHETLGRPSLTATTIEGGAAMNQVPAACRIGFDRRSVPPETADGFRAGLEEHLSEWLPDGYDLTVALTDREAPFLEAFATDGDDPLVEALADASGGEVRPFGAATEASLFARRAPTVVFGPGVLSDDDGAVAHSAREHVDLADLDAACDALRAALAELL